jgi:hypothetical protein
MTLSWSGDAVPEWIWTGNGWEYDSRAPQADNSATSMMPVYAATDAEPVITTEPATGPIPQVAFQPAEYVYTDPVTDEAWPGITAPDDDNPPDCFPDGWGSEPTERDQAAIDAGNA